MDTTTKKNKLEPSFGPPRIQTFEDAVNAFLRQEIDEKGLEEAAGLYGQADSITHWIPSRLEKPDAAFIPNLPEDFYDEPGYSYPTIEERLEIVEKKEAVREAARKASEKIVANVRPEVESAEAKNEAAAKAAEKPQESLDKTVAEATAPEGKK